MSAMTALGDKIRRWCEEESLSAVVEQDDESALACAVSPPGDPSLSIAVRASGPQPSRVLLAHTFELPIPVEIAADPDAPQRIATLLDRVAASRSGLIDCRPLAPEGKAAEVTLTLHADGISKQNFLCALDEVCKVVRVIEWELEGISAAADIVSNVRSLVEQTGTFASELAQAVAAPAEGLASPAQPEGAPPTSAAPQPPPPAPAATPVAAPAAGVFCTECGRQARPGARFCNGCGSPLEA